MCRAENKRQMSICKSDKDVYIKQKSHHGATLLGTHSIGVSL